MSRAGYYKWLRHERTEEEKENEVIAQLIREYDEQFGHTLGYRRMTGYINRLNHKQYGEKRVHRIMQMLKEIPTERSGKCSRERAEARLQCRPTQ